MTPGTSGGGGLVLASQELAREAGLLERGPRAIHNTAPRGDSIIVIHLGPGQVPEVAHILRSQWKTVTALNYALGCEFHVRLRQHQPSGVCIVYASVSRSSKNRDARSIFGDVVQRGRVVRTPDQIKAAIVEIRKELGIESPGKPLP